VDGPTHKVLAQVNQSDLAFLRERARAVDAELWLSGTSLNVKARNRRQSGDVTLTLGQGLLEFTVLADLANQVTAFRVSGWDVSAKDSISFEATDSALAGEVNGFQSGSSILASAVAARSQQVVHRLPFTQTEAQGLAEHYYRATARRFVTGHGTAEGDARLHVGTQLQLDGIGPLFEGKYYVTRVRHIFDSVRGFQTDFAVERPGIGQA
jgi:phage protein D